MGIKIIGIELLIGYCFNFNIDNLHGQIEVQGDNSVINEEYVGLIKSIEKIGFKKGISISVIFGVNNHIFFKKIGYERFEEDSFYKFL